MNKTKDILMTAFVFIFVSTSIVQGHIQISQPRNNKSDCVTIAKYFDDVDYMIGGHSKYSHLLFVLVGRDKLIFIFEMMGTCIGKRVILDHKHPLYGGVVSLIFSGRMA